ncbi:hypothetical protein [Phenylobacterium ferrooxidans]|uniref:Tail sheath protein subtilisin-like domain-containing protein n=1 Tax=Phenylobacterium ferrooxidans TaxID=2982689 RepID=A0ABW6CMT3_9CAUL
MAYFFNGNMIESPAVVSRVDDSAMLNRSINVGNIVALLGKCTGGQPGTVLRFSDPTAAAAALGSGELVSAVKRAFAPSADTASPAEVLVVRVNPATQSTLVLKDSLAATVATLTSTGYGLRENQIKVKIEAATNTGLKITTQRGDAYYTQDDIFRNAFKVRYSGAQVSAVMTVSSTQVILQAPSGTAVATIDLATYPTVQELVDRINAVSGFAASVQDGNGEKLTLQGLDACTTQDVKTADYIAKAHLQAVIDWFNGAGEGYVTAVRAADVGTLPAAIPFTYMADAIEGVTTNTEWTAGFTALQSVDAQWVVPISSDPAIHAMADAHCVFMSGIGRRERRSICGAPLATTDAAAIVLAKAINSDRTSLVHIGGWDYNDAGVLTLYPPYIVAAMVAGAFAGLTPGTPLTNKSLRLRGLERKLRNPTDTDALIRGGVMALEDTGTAYKVVKSISTWLTNTKFNRVEQSVGVALDYTARAVRNALEQVKGIKANPQSLALAASLVETTLRELAKPEPNGLGVLAGDEESPAYKDIRATLAGDVIAVTAQVSPVIPANYIAITLHAVPYSGAVAVG